MSFMAAARQQPMSTGGGGEAARGRALAVRTGRAKEEGRGGGRGGEEQTRHGCCCSGGRDKLYTRGSRLRNPFVAGQVECKLQLVWIHGSATLPSAMDVSMYDRGRPSFEIDGFTTAD